MWIISREKLLREKFLQKDKGLFTNTVVLYSFYCGVEGSASPVSVVIAEYDFLAQGYKVSDFYGVRGDMYSKQEYWDNPCPYPETMNHKLLILPPQ